MYAGLNDGQGSDRRGRWRWERVRLREWGDDDRHRIGKRGVSKKWEWGRGPFRDQWGKERLC